MTDRDDLAALDRRHVWHPFTQSGTAPAPVVIAGGDGAWLIGTDGKRYLDLVSSWWVNIHGHAHPRVAAAIAEQAGKLEQLIFADFTHEPAIRLAARICAMLPADLNRVFYSDNGSTSVEVALKIAHQYWRNRGEPRRTRYIAFDGGYHGDTVGAMSAGTGSGFFRAFAPMLFPVDVVPFPDTWDGDDGVEAREQASLRAIEKCFEADPGAMAAVIVEPLIQGAGGMRMCRPEFLGALATLVRERGALLIFDEVMTGFGRTGASFACTKADVAPDLICLSKGLSGGFLPLAMTVCSDDIHDAFVGETLEQAFLHGHSFTANPLGCAAALVSLDMLQETLAAGRLDEIEGAHRRHMAALARHPKVRRPRVAGTIAAFDVAGATGYGAVAGRGIKQFCLQRGFLVRPLGHVVYLLPPYCITDAEIADSYSVLAASLDAL